MSSDWQPGQVPPGPDFVPSAQVPPMGTGVPQRPDFASPAGPAPMPGVAATPAPPMVAPAPRAFPGPQPHPTQFAPQPSGPQPQQPPYPGQFQPGMAPMTPPMAQPGMPYPGAPMYQPMLPPGVVPIRVETIPNHPLAITALITSVICLVNFLFPLGLLPLILGIIAHVLISRNSMKWRGKGMAMAAIIIGGLSTLLSAFIIAMIITDS